MNHDVILGLYGTSFFLISDFTSLHSSPVISLFPPRNNVPLYLFPCNSKGILGRGRSQAHAVY